MKQRIALATLIVALILTLAILLGDRFGDQNLDPVGPVRIALSRTASPMPIWIAQQRGLLKRAGVDATLIECATGKACTEMMLNGDAELAAAAEFLAAKVAFRQPELRVLATTAFVHTIKLQALRERGISRISDLAGKRAGVRLGTNGEYFLARLLTLNGLQHNTIHWVDLKPAEMASALSARQVDAVLVWPPFSNRIAAEFGDRLVEFDGQSGQDYYYLLLSRQDWVTSHPLIAERVLLALKWAEEWMLRHPREALQLIASILGVPAGELAADFRKTRYAISLPQALLTALESESSWLHLQGTPGQPVANSLDLIFAAPLAAVAPQAVTLVQPREPD
jgi:ABC-type nitrate/sulfonate/bicarbonate transport system substrate-binding protein